MGPSPHPRPQGSAGRRATAARGALAEVRSPPEAPFLIKGIRAPGPAPDSTLASQRPQARARVPGAQGGHDPAE